MLSFLIASLAVWRMTVLLVREDGPGDLFTKIRNVAGIKYDELSRPYPTNMLSGMLSCVWCCSVWVGFVVALFEKPCNFSQLLRNSLALSASAIFIDEIIDAIEVR